MIEQLPKIIFLSGVHGVGKTTLGKEISKKSEILSLSASEIIKKTKSTNLKKNKQVDNVDGNQEILLLGMEKQLNPLSVYLIDGHFCLLKTKNTIEKINERIFHRISPLAVFMLYDDPILIHSRLNIRDDEKPTVDIIKKLQDCEMEQSLKISKIIDIPFHKINSSAKDVGDIIKTMEFYFK